MTYKISDLPPSCKGFIESLENLLVLEKLSNPNFYLSISKNEEYFLWKVHISGLPSPIIVPFVVKSTTHPSLRIENKANIVPQNQLNDFIENIKEAGVVIALSPNSKTNDWLFLFQADNSFYNFYLVCKKYKVF